MLSPQNCTEKAADHLVCRMPWYQQKQQTRRNPAPSTRSVIITHPTYSSLHRVGAPSEDPCATPRLAICIAEGKRRLPGERYYIPYTGATLCRVHPTSLHGTEFSEHVSVRDLNHHRACSRLEGVGRRDGVDLDQVCLADGNLTCHVRPKTRLCVDVNQRSQDLGL
jgi:hypothetical protein